MLRVRELAHRLKSCYVTDALSTSVATSNDGHSPGSGARVAADRAESRSIASKSRE